MRALKVKRAHLLEYTPFGNGNQKTVPNDHFKAEVKYIPGLLIVIHEGRQYGVPDSNVIMVELEEDPSLEPKPVQPPPQQQGRR